MRYTWEHPFAFDTAAIPKAAAEQLRMASGPQVKVLIWLACAGQGQFDTAACAAACGMAPAVCEEAFRYWAFRGLIAAEKTPTTPAAPVPTAQPAPEQEAAPVKDATPTLSGAPSAAVYPDRAQVLRQKTEDTAFSMLLDTACTKLGKILSPADMSVFLYLYRELSLPPEVILMVIGYAVQNGKGKMAYIEKTAIAWAQDGINTFEAADAHVRRLEDGAQAWDTLCQWQELEIARPTVAQKEIARRWICEWKMSRDVIETVLAYTFEKLGKYQLSYADRVMERLHAQNITTAEGAKVELTAEKKQKSAKKATSRARMKTAKDRAPSYDMAEYEKMVRRHRPMPPGED